MQIIRHQERDSNNKIPSIHFCMKDKNSDSERSSQEKITKIQIRSQCKDVKREISTTRK